MHAHDVMPGLESTTTRSWTAAELSELDGESGLQLGVGLLGKVYDVSCRPDLYGFGGGYHRFAGKVCTRSFALTALDLEHIGRSDLVDLKRENFVALREWEALFERKYDRLGVLSEEEPDARSVQNLEELERRHGIDTTKTTGNKKGAENIKQVVDAAGHNLLVPAVVHKEEDGIMARNLLTSRCDEHLDADGRVEAGATTPVATSSQVLSSTGPAAYLFTDFLSQSECEVLRKLILKSYEGRTFSTKLRTGLAPESYPVGSEAREVLERLENGLGELLNCPRHPGEDPLMAMVTPPQQAMGSSQEQQEEPKSVFHLGIHLDANRRPFRYATAIIYLSDLPRNGGGETVFLPKTEDTALLHRHGVLHTDLVDEERERLLENLPNELRSVDKLFGEIGLRKLLEDVLHMPQLTAAARAVYPEIVAAKGRLLQAAASEKRPGDVERDPVSAATGPRTTSLLKVRPREGQMLVFFTRTPDLTLCTGSYHGGARVSNGFKFTLQKFKELPRNDPAVAFATLKQDWSALIAGALGNCEARVAAERSNDSSSSGLIF
ncbi:unnamed protein product [Amoebophrya sp. A120]|nr:unnamed protein product [Amoebophrya sp. A120]|eukprot:GSA120T00025241001.1